jgi:hypothetical protein
VLRFLLGQPSVRMVLFQLYMAELPGKVYIGCTGFDLADRCERMQKEPVWWLRGHPQLRRLRLKPLLGRRVGLETCLALEVAATALAWVKEPALVRGGPWCLKLLRAKEKTELLEIVAALRGARTQREQVAAVLAVSRRSPRSGGLARHLHNECFKCGLKLQLCSCRQHRRQDIGITVVKKRQSGKAGGELPHLTSLTHTSLT